MQNLFRAFTLMVDYDMRESLARENKTYLIRWNCNECKKSGRFHVENFVWIIDEIDKIKCQCNAIHMEKIGDLFNL